MGSCVLPGGNSHDRQRNARSLFGCIDFRSSPTQPARTRRSPGRKVSTNPRVATMLAAEIWWDPIANFSAAKFRMRNRGHLLLSRPRKNRLSWFSFFISANQLRSVLLSVVSGGGFQHWLLFFLFSASRFLAAHKKLHSFKP